MRSTFLHPLMSIVLIPSTAKPRLSRSIDSLLCILRARSLAVRRMLGSFLCVVVGLTCGQQPILRSLFGRTNIVALATLRLWLNPWRSRQGLPARSGPEPYNPTGKKITLSASSSEQRMLKLRPRNDGRPKGRLRHGS